MTRQWFSFINFNHSPLHRCNLGKSSVGINKPLCVFFFVWILSHRTISYLHCHAFSTPALSSKFSLPTPAPPNHCLGLVLLPGGPAMLMVNENDDTLEARIVANTKTRHDNALRIILDEVIKLSEPSFSRGPRDESVQMAQFLI